MNLKQFCAALRVAAPFLLACFAISTAPAQQLDEAAIIQHVDAAVKARLDAIAEYTAIEHYAVYREETGKSYTPISQSGSAIIRSQVLGAILENEKLLNQPGNREAAWITSANYRMQLKPSAHELLDGRDCIVLTLVPRQRSPHLFTGTLWVDAKDFSIVQLQGVTSKSPSFLTGPTNVMRQYAREGGFAQATHARAVSNSFLFGETIVKIDYSDYQVQLRPTR